MTRKTVAERTDWSTSALGQVEDGAMWLPETRIVPLAETYGLPAEAIMAYMLVSQHPTMVEAIKTVHIPQPSRESIRRAKAGERVLGENH